jgi:hypothetical protein
MTRNLMRYLISIFSLILIAAGFALPGKAQTPIGGTVNNAIDVVSIDGPDQLTVSDASGFSEGDTVLVIQMKGIQINITDVATNYGSLQNTYSAGKYEFLIIAGITGNQVTFAADFTNSYDAQGMVQMVRVATYDNAVVSSDITAQAWDPANGYGGVIALIVGNTLTLNADIDASEAGFRGADISITNGVCATFDVELQYAYYNAASDTAGFKGEGSTTYYTPNNGIDSIIGPAYAKGRGANFNGGGGGNARMSGGGGGGNIGTGGFGGVEANDCTPELNVGGWSGRSINGVPDWNPEKRIFMGGGGGAGTELGAYTATLGGHGGGIVIIIADTLVGNGHTIRANGQDVTGLASASGGGGGAGGTILLNITEYKTAFNVEVMGGDGGNTDDGVFPCTGAGGGGGGGLIWTANSPTLAANITTSLDGGAGGEAEGSCVNNFGSAGGNGQAEPGLVVPLTGFLFNSIYSVATGVRTDTICEGDIPAPFEGTLPKGGTPPYQYRWESSPDLSSWSVEVDYGAGTTTFAPSTNLVDTTYYRRLIRDNSVPQIIDVSKPITIVVQPQITGNVFAVDDTVCSGSPPDTIFASPRLPSGGDGPGSYLYEWQESADGGSNWNTLPGETDHYYLPPTRNFGAITEYQYRRIVRSGIGCPDTSNAMVLTYLPALVNDIGDDHAICDGQVPDLLVNLDVSGGTGSFVYSWQVSNDNVNFGAELDNTLEYQPSAITHGTANTEYRYFRRTVTSSACTDSSAVVEVIVYPLISGNTIGSDQTICKGTRPVTLTGDTYSGGGGTYAFEWLLSDDGGVNYITTGATSESYDPNPLSTAHYFKRVITSDACADTSAVPVFIDIHTTFTAEISDLSGGTDTVCNGGSGQVEIDITDYTGGAPWDIYLSGSPTGITGEYTGVNTMPFSAGLVADIGMTGTTGEATLTVQIDSIKDQWGCHAESFSGQGTIITLRPPVANPGQIQPDPCGFTVTLNATPPWDNPASSGGWTGPGGVVFSDPQLPDSDVTVPGEAMYTLTWTVDNGICDDDQATIDIQFWEPPSPAVITDPPGDITLAAFANEIDMTAQPVPVGTIQWSSTGPANFTPDNAEMTTASDLDWGPNLMRLYISNGTCPEERDSVVVTVEENVFIPQGISPQVSIGRNDYFWIENVGNVPNELVIFARNGNIVYQTDNFMSGGNTPEDGWDGRDMKGNPLPDDTYYYVLNVRGDFPKTFSGYIVIKGNR